MLACFPHPYPDEILYSLYARYSYRMRFPNLRLVIKEIFGSVVPLSITEPPQNLNHIVGRLPPGYFHTVDDVIDQHTIFPFYKPFLDQESIQQIRDSISGAVPARGLRFANERPSLRPNWLRFCPTLCSQRSCNLWRNLLASLASSPGSCRLPNA